MFLHFVQSAADLGLVRSVMRSCAPFTVWYDTPWFLLARMWGATQPMHWRLRAALCRRCPPRCRRRQAVVGVMGVAARRAVDPALSPNVPTLPPPEFRNVPSTAGRAIANLAGGGLGARALVAREGASPGAATPSADDRCTSTKVLPSTGFAQAETLLCSACRLADTSSGARTHHVGHVGAQPKAYATWKPWTNRAIAGATTEYDVATHRSQMKERSRLEPAPLSIPDVPVGDVSRCSRRRGCA